MVYTAEDYFNQFNKLRIHNLNLIDDKYRHIVEVLLDWEDSLSDGYYFYCDYVATEQAHEKYDDDYVLSALVEIAKEILEEYDIYHFRRKG